MKRTLHLISILLCIACAGCGGSDTAGNGPGGGQSTAEGGGEGGGSNWAIRDTGVAQMELGMTEQELREATRSSGGELAAANPAPEGLKGPVLVASRGGEPLLYAEMK